jgi:hypothetical protein
MTGNPFKTPKLSELSDDAQNLLSSYRTVWDERLESAKEDLSENRYREIIESFYLFLNLPTPLVVLVDSPMQMMLMPALLRIRALCDRNTWQAIRASLTLPRWKKTIEALDEKISESAIERLIAAREDWNTFLKQEEQKRDQTNRMTAIDSIFGRPKGKSIDSRLGFFESLTCQLDAALGDSVTPEIREWVGSESLFVDGGMPGRLEDFRNPEFNAEISRLTQIHIAIQNLTNMGTTERAALRIFRERGDAPSILPEQLVRQGELETDFLQQLGEETVSILAHALSAKNLEPTIYESYPPVLEAMLDGGSTGLWLTGQLSVGYNSMIFHPRLERLSNFTFFLDAGEKDVFEESTAQAVENLRVFLANRTPICPFGEIVFVSKQPLDVVVNEEGRLHSTEGPAISYADGYRIYSINGVTVNEKTAVAPETLTVEEIEAEINLEVRRIMLERFGIGRYLLESKADVLNEDEYGTLYRKRIAGDEPLLMVRVKNSTAEPDGSYREYFLRVPPFVRTAREAVAWTFDFDEDQYQPEEET